jgi:hypothetical protein
MDPDFDVFIACRLTAVLEKLPVKGQKSVLVKGKQVAYDVKFVLNAGMNVKGFGALVGRKLFICFSWFNPKSVTDSLMLGLRFYNGQKIEGSVWYVRWASANCN